MVPILNIPILSVVLVLLAGILIGHLIWFRDRGADEAEIAGLQDENHQLQCSLHEHKQAYDELDGELQNQRAAAEELRATHQQLQSRWHEADSQRARASSDLARVQMLADQAFHDLDQERQQRRMLEDSSKHLQSQLDVVTQQTTNSENACRTLQSEKVQLSQQFEQLAKQNSDLQTLLATLQQSRPNRVSSADLSNKDVITELREQVTQQDEYVGSLRRERDQLASQLNKESKRRAFLENAVQSKERLLGELTEHAREFDRLHAMHREVHGQPQGNAAELSSRVDQLSAAHDQARGELAQTRESLHRLERDLAASEQTVRSLQAERDDARDDLELMRSRCETLEQKTSHVENLVQLRDDAMRCQRDSEVLIEQLRAQLQEAQSQYQAIAAEQAEFTDADLDADDNLNDNERQRREELERQLCEVHNLLRQRDSAMEREMQASGALTQLQQLVADRCDELNALRQECEQALQLANHERDQRLLVLDELDYVRSQHSEIQSQLSADKAHESLVAELNQHMLTQQAQLESVVRDRDEMQLRLEEERERLQAMEAQLTSVNQSDKAELHEMRTRQQFAHESISKLQSELTARSRQFDNLRDSLHETAADFQRERHQREHLQHAIVERDAQIERLEVEVNSLRQQQGSANQTIDQFQGQLQRLTTERDQLQQQKGQWEAVKRGLLSQFDHSQAQLDAITAEFEATRAHERDLQRELQNQIQQTQLSAQQVQDLQRVVEQQKHLQSTLEDTTQRLRKVLLQRDEALATSAESDDVIAELRKQVQVGEAEHAALQSRWQEINEMLTSEKAKGLELAAALEAKTKTFGRLQKELTELENLRREHTEVQARLSEATQRLRRIADQREEALQLANVSQQQVEQLDARVQAAEETIRNLRRERTAMLSRFRQSPSNSQAMSDVDADTANMRRDEVRGWVYSQPPKRKDDLKKISGVAEVLEQKLNAFGVYTYRQIMQWDEIAIAEFSKLMSFKDRIIREDWVGQARRLQQELYGRAA